ncbi:hypothetical protein [Pseudoalteromonas denitrificans]|uniref:Uncharacterized protein n=1 Tax=Pseudoalteromonas denitrificans DSM 6059 TaxID=1123010 RepID=A0A1I1FBW1_9GAMM|nr:hypothetical protein [Pseudoalteromonas denitrificans]SFB96426.1 hypothetical protein SAMN02745724_00566 [Pseudoalteromonas denitrificans DSM 6059]
MSRADKFQATKLIISIISIVLIFNLMSAEYTHWRQKLTCQDRCLTLGFKNCTYTPENINIGQSERCVCGAQKDQYLVLN